MTDTRPDDTRIVYCRELDLGMVLHMSAYGEDYVLRRFDGSDPFDVTQQPTYEGLTVCYRFDYDRPLTAEESQHEVEDTAYWSERIAEVNEEVLPTVGGQSESRS